VQGPWSEAFSDRAGMHLRVVRADRHNGGCDAHPVTPLGDASVAELARQSGLEAVDHRRFRMTIGFGGAAPHLEDTWKGRVLAQGSAILQVGGATPRCNAINRYPERGQTDLKVLRLIRDYRGIAITEQRRSIDFGVYADVLEAGVVRVGDRLEVGPEP
jgi:uncharacterized protein YcbX